MTSGGVLVLLFLFVIGAVCVATVRVVVRGGRGPGDPPASHPRIDPAGFPVLAQPRGAVHVARRAPRIRRLAVRQP
jgi:hypothetical protein